MSAASRALASAPSKRPTAKVSAPGWPGTPRRELRQLASTAEDPAVQVAARAEVEQGGADAELVLSSHGRDTAAARRS
eukprot:2502555-Alexandrium_andersonii.AAC.1